MIDQMIGQARNSPWFITQEDVQKYHRIMDGFDPNKQGFLKDEEMQKVFQST